FLGARRDGVLTAMRHLSVTTTALHHEFVEPTGHRTTARLYACPNVEIAHALAEIPVGAPTYMRAPGEAPGTFALESALDELSWALAMDPVALRLANHAEKDPKSGKPWSAKALRECYRAGAERFGWKAKRPDPRSQKEGEWLFGQGMASAVYPGYRAASTARVRILESGRAQVSSATHDLGTGMYTLLAQAVGDALSLPLDAVDVELGDSSLPPAALAGGSMSTASVLPAVRKAAEAALAKLVDLAAGGEGAALSGLARDAVEARQGRLVSKADPSRGEAFSAVLARAGKGAVEATETAAPGQEGADHSFSSFGAHFVEVGVDRFTCEVRVHRVVSAMSIGSVLNPKAARSQVIGGVAGGIGMALLEESRLDARTGRFTTLDLSSYRVPVNADVPHVEVLFVGEPDIAFNPLGARGVGEIGITGIAAAVANAVYHATGLRVRDLPITPEKLLG
ncbi:MAG: xanthine dehydrogenase family protein molybdopterin-binding subunit, partial [Acidobacteria bacterium]|nr:xanthine dehydrogenase family protein molybdopterin-binding subunit [Acidobacteriota bacterium]